MKVQETSLPGVLLLEAEVFADERGHFREIWRREGHAEAGIPPDFVQDNAALSRRGVLRGLHYQHPRPQGKLVGVVAGEVFDVAVDLRPDSPGFGRWTGHLLSGENGRQLWIPPGFAHGYLTLSESAVFLYKCTAYYQRPWDRAVAWDDPTIAVAWPLAAGARPRLSEKDARAPRLSQLTRDLLPGG